MEYNLSESTLCPENYCKNPECIFVHNKDLLLCSEDYLENKCSQMENCLLRHPSIENILWNELRLFHDFKFTMENFAALLTLKLEIYRRKINYLESRHIGLTIKKLFPNLRELELFFSENALDEKGVQEILENLIAFKELRVLKLAFISCNLGNTSCNHIWSLINNNLKNLKVVSINLSNNNIEINGFYIIWKAIETLENIERIELNFDLFIFIFFGEKNNKLQRNPLRKQIFCGFPFFMTKNPQKVLMRLNYFVLSLGGNHLKFEDLIKILKFVQIENFPSLQYLDLHLDNNELKNEGLFFIMEQIQSKKMQLLYLDALNCSINNIDGLIDNFKGWNSLKFLHLNFKMNQIKKESIIKAVELTATSQQLVDCALDFNFSLDNNFQRSYKILKKAVIIRRVLIYQTVALIKKLKKFKLRAGYSNKILERTLQKAISLDGNMFN